MLSASAMAYTPFLPEDYNEEATESEGTAQEDTETEADTEAEQSNDNTEQSDDNTEQSDDNTEQSDADTEEAEKAQESEKAEDTDGEGADADESDKEAPMPPHNVITPTNYYYRLFMQIMDTYVERHLYDFSKQDVMESIFNDFLADNPMYFKYLTQYLLSSMDPYSSYHEKDDGFLDGVGAGSTGFGITIQQEDDGVYITSVVPGSNAQKAGLAVGDRLTEIQGINVERLCIEPIMVILANPLWFAPTSETAAENTTENTEASVESTDGNGEKEKAKEVCDITVDRNGEKKSFTLEKGVLNISQISTSIDENDGKKTAYISVASFMGDNTAEEFNTLVKKYHDEGIKYLTIDLRDNGGGSLDFALSMAETFIPKEQLICYYNDKTLEEPRPIYSTTDHVTFDSVTIMINEHTASAAELMTSILQSNGIAKVIGTLSYGKSIGQEIYYLANGDYITITTYEILDHNLESYNEIGIMPDLVIENVEMCYTLPTLDYFNHQNYVEIKEGEYSIVTKALEDRLNVMGYLYEEDCDGIFDKATSSALYIYQKARGLEATGYVTPETVTSITRVINSYKSYSYYEDTQYDVAMIVHHSFSQGKRLVKEKQKLAEKQAKLIADRDAALEAARDAELEAKAQEKDSEQTNTSAGEASSENEANDAA